MILCHTAIIITQVQMGPCAVASTICPHQDAWRTARWLPASPSLLLQTLHGVRSGISSSLLIFGAILGKCIVGLFLPLGMPFCFNIRCNIKDVLFCTKPAGRGLSCFRGDEKIMASTLKGIQLAVCDYNSICIFRFWFLYVFSDIGWIDPIGLEGFVYILIELRIKYILKILVLFPNHFH